MAKILDDCRDLAIHRLLLSFASMLDRVSDQLMTRAGNSDVREDQLTCLDARELLRKDRSTLLTEFERQLRLQIDGKVKGEAGKKSDFSSVDARKLALVDTLVMDESIVIGNIVRVVENTCHDELLEFNRAVAYLLGRPELELTTNPLAPATIVQAFMEALRSLKGEERAKYAILKELNQSSLGDINAIYADLNRHLESLHVMPHGGHFVRRTGGASPRVHAAEAQAAHPPLAPSAPAGEVDLMAVLQRLAGRGAVRPGTTGVPGAFPGAYAMRAGEGGDQPLPAIGPYGGPRILATQEIGD